MINETNIVYAPTANWDLNNVNIFLYFEIYIQVLAFFSKEVYAILIKINNVANSKTFNFYKNIQNLDSYKKGSKFHTFTCLMIALGLIFQQLSLTNGVVRGFDTMYRRSVATGVKEKDIRRVDALVAFSNLKVS